MNPPRLDADEQPNPADAHDVADLQSDPQPTVSNDRPLSRLAAKVRAHPIVVASAGLAIAILVVSVAVVIQSMRVEVPDLAGLHEREAAEATTEAGLEWADANLEWTDDVPTKFQVAGEQLPVAGEIVWRGSTVDVVFIPATIEIPSVIGLEFGEAASKLQALGLRVTAEGGFETEAQGWEVLDQEVDRRQAVPAGTSIELSLDIPEVEVPELVGMSRGEAESALTSLGLSLRWDQRSSDMDWEVVAQEVAPQSVLQFGSWVDVQVLPPKIAVPNVVGIGQTEAVRLLEEAGFVVKVSPDSVYEEWKVRSQSPGANALVREGATVSIVLKEPRIVFSVSGNGSRALITWTKPGDSFSIGQENNASIPWKISFPLTSGYGGNLSAQMLNGSSITCTITVDGRVTSRVTSTGPYAIAMCG